LTLANRESFEKIYRIEQDAKTKERILLVLNVVYQGKISAAQVARDLHRSKAWACEWLKRYSKEGIEGLKDRTKSGRPPKLSKETSYQIKQELKQSNQGWTTKQVEELIIKKSGIKYHSIHIYPVSFENGALSRRYQERYMLIQHPGKKKTISKKDRTDIFVVDKQQSKSSSRKVSL
jgi:putative transposase